MAAHLEDRPGYTEKAAPDALQRDLGKLLIKHGITGLLLIDFSGDRISVRCCGKTPEFMSCMDALGKRVLTDIDDGRHDDVPGLFAPAAA